MAILALGYFILPHPVCACLCSSLLIYLASISWNSLSVGYIGIFKWSIKTLHVNSDILASSLYTRQLLVT